MRCLNCNQVVEGKFDYCPICGCKYDDNPQEYTGNYPIIQEEDERKKLLEIIKNSHEENIELDDLPDLKTEDEIEINSFDNNLTDNNEDSDYNGVTLSDEYDNDEFDEKQYEEEIEKTRTINPFLDQTDDLSLTNEIKKQMNDFSFENQHSSLEKIEKDNNNIIVEDEEFNSKKSVNERKNTLIVAFVCMLVIIGVCCVALYKLENDKNEDEKIQYSVNDVEKIYNEFINSNNSEELKKILKENKNINSSMENIQKEIDRLMNKSVDKLIENEYSSLNSFNNDYNKYKNAFSTIYSITEDNQGTVRLITSDSYKIINDRLNDLDNDAKGYFEALNYYNEKSYNEAYYVFNKVDSDSKFYDKSKKYLEEIVDSVIILIKTDITKMESGIEELDDDGKLIRYSQIEDVIIAYDGLYDNLKLSSNEEYNSLLASYKDKVNQYNN